MNKRTLIRKGFIIDDASEERMGTRKLKNKKAKAPVIVAPVKIDKAVITTENLTVKILSEKIGKTAQEIIKQLMLLGIMTNINSVVDFRLWNSLPTNSASNSNLNSSRRKRKNSKQCTTRRITKKISSNVLPLLPLWVT
ncbi:MAG: translation initiation factor IF-2 N-terminal domain-containing protein [Christensenellales bacterium]